MSKESIERQKSGRRKADVLGLAATLTKASQAALREFKTVELLHNKAEAAFRAFDSALKGHKSLIAQAEMIDGGLANALKQVVQERRAFASGEWARWKGLFENRRRRLNRFTVMLFGRTMSGKSTTLEAFIGGDGARIGNGTPDFTRDIEEFDWHGIHLVDTPGIEGFSPDLIERAIGFVDEADMVMMVVSDDHIEPELIRNMASILRQNKPLVILLNVKAGDVARLERKRDRVFRVDEIEGHTSHIRECLLKFFREEHGAINANQVPILPFHAAAAFLSQRLREEEPERALRLYELSGMKHIVEHLRETILSQASTLRPRVEYDAFLWHLQNIEGSLRQRLAMGRRELESFGRENEKLKRLLGRVARDGRKRFEGLRKHFYEVEEETGDLVDRIVAGDEKNPKHAFGKLLRLEELEKSIRTLRSEVAEEVCEHLAAFEESTKLNLTLEAKQAWQETTVELEADLAGVRWANLKKTAAKGVRVIGGPLAGFGVGYAALNFWNPTGWLAGGLALLAATATGLTATKITQEAGNAIERSGRRWAWVERRALRREMRKLVWEQYNSVERENENWLNDVINKAQETVSCNTEAIRSEVAHFLDAGYDLVRALEAFRKEAATAELTLLVSEILGADVAREIEVCAAARRLGYRTKVGVAGRNGRNVAGLLIGTKGSGLARLSEHLGHEGIDVVELPPDGGLTQRAVASALRPANVREEDVSLPSNAKAAAVQVRTDADLAGLLFGTYHWNLGLAKQLIGKEIKVLVS
mgnify:CR=1 FL=1